VRSYIEERNKGFYVAGSRVTLESVIYAFRQGEAPESIRANFPSLTLEKIYGAIAEYLGGREEFDRYLAETEAEWIEFASRNPMMPEIRQKLTRARDQLGLHQ
jgi:uncharacterized protein (DUF433 family)